MEHALPRSIRSRVAQSLTGYPLLLRGARLVFRLVNGIRSEEAWLRDVAERRREVFFLQIGANDGVMEDPLRPFVLQYGWHGLLLEPIQSYYDSLVKNYADAPGLIFENKALADRDEARPFYRLRQDAGLPEWCNGVGSFDRDVITLHRDTIPDIDRYVVAQDVQCVTFKTLIARHALERIDVMVCDTEGYDLEILRQIDFERYRPELVIYEQVLLSETDKRAAIRLLERYGYVVHRIGLNNAAVLQSTERR